MGLQAILATLWRCMSWKSRLRNWTWVTQQKAFYGLVNSINSPSFRKKNSEFSKNLHGNFHEYPMALKILNLGGKYPVFSWTFAHSLHLYFWSLSILSSTIKSRFKRPLKKSNFKSWLGRRKEGKNIIFLIDHKQCWRHFPWPKINGF